MSTLISLTEDSPMAYAARPPKRAPIHPGLVAADSLNDVDGSLREHAAAMGMTHSNLDAILKGKRPVTAETAVRFGIYFGNGPDIWLRMQNDYDLYQARQKLAAELRKIVPLAKD